MSFLTVAEFYNLGHIQGILRVHFKGALTQKRSFLVVCTTLRSDFHVGWINQNKCSTLNLSFHALSKWHEPDIYVFLLRHKKWKSSTYWVAGRESVKKIGGRFVHFCGLVEEQNLYIVFYERLCPSLHCCSITQKCNKTSCCIVPWYCQAILDLAWL